MFFFKYRFPNLIKVMAVVIVITAIVLTVGSAGADDAKRAFFDPLLDWLIADGFDEQRIKKIYQSEAVFFETRGVTQYFMHNEAKLDYNKLTRKSLIRDARAYMSTHEDALNKAPNQIPG